MERLDYNLLFRWFVGLAMDAPIRDVTVFTKNRERLLAGDAAARFFQAELGQPEVRALLSDERFSVDGTLIEAFASMKSFRPKADGGDVPPAGGGRNAERDFHGERRSNDSHASTTEVVPERRASGTAERAAALAMLGRQGRPAPRHARRRQGLRCRRVRGRSARPERHPARRPEHRQPAIDGRITRHPGYAASQRSASGSRRASRRTARAKRGRVQTPSGAGASSRAEAQAGAQRRDAALGEGLLAPAGGPGDAVRVDVLGVPPPRDG